ncbi:MAG: hypothetical protein K9M99_13410 [Candidatus Cloacimonetes bacterium]|nr:hypothetical protein [Candidatus Cloacimonadota bacterium]
MYMIMHLLEEKYLDDVMMALVEAGVDNTMVLSGENLSHKLTMDMPIFAGFRKTLRGHGYSKIIMGMASKNQVDFALDELLNAGVDLIGKSLAEITLIPVDHYYRGDV